MEHSEHRGHRISTEARPVGDRWRGYWRVDDGMFRPVERIAQTEHGAHLEAKARAVAAINRRPIRAA